MSRQTILLTLTFYRRWRLLGRHPSRTRCIRDCTGVMLDQMRLRWRTIGIHVRHGWPCSKIFVITIRFGGEFLARGRVILKLITITVGPIQRETEAPIVYSSLQEWHLDQVHDLLTRTFWSGIDSTSSIPPILLPVKKGSQRLPALPTGTCNGYRDIQTARGRRRDPQLAVGNVHHVSGGETWLG